MKIARIITGTDRQLIVTWKVSNVITPIPTTADVRFRIVSRDKKTTYTSILTADSAHPSADWEAGKIVLVFPAAETTGIEMQGVTEVELQVASGGSKLGTFFPVNITKGNIG